MSPARQRWTLLKTITTFTFAHSLQWRARRLGIFGCKQKPVEAAIALSIVFLASEPVKMRWESGFYP